LFFNKKVYPNSPSSLLKNKIQLTKQSQKSFGAKSGNFFHSSADLNYFILSAVDE